MIDLSFDNVMLNFQQLAQCTPEVSASCAAFVNSAVFQIGLLVDQTKYSYSDKNACEYAAAAYAYYDFVCSMAAREKIQLSAEGKVVQTNDFTQKLNAVMELKKSAMEKISRILYDTDFVFIGTQDE